MEQEAAGALQKGEVLDLTGSDGDNVIRASFIRDLVLGRHMARDDEGCDPRGLWLCGVTVRGRLDFDYLQVATPLGFGGCVLEDGISLRYGQLAHLALDGSRIEAGGDAGIAVDARQATIRNNLMLTGAVIRARSEWGAVDLSDARIGGQLSLDDAELFNEIGPALTADGLVVETNALLRMEARGRGGYGAVRLSAARVSGQLNLNGAELFNDTGPALAADRLTVDGDALLQMEATGSGDHAVGLLGGHIGGQLILDSATITNLSGSALNADDLIADGTVSLCNLEAVGETEAGTVRLVGARIRGVLDFTDAVLTNDSGPALVADQLDVSDSAHLSAHLAGGSGTLGAVRLPGAHVRGQLILANSTLINESGPSLYADSLVVDNGASLEGMTARGVVQMCVAKIGGTLLLDDAELINYHGPALDADGLLGAKVSLRMKEARGTGDRGAVRLLGAHVDGQLILSGASVTNYTGPAVAGDGLVVDGNAYLVIRGRGGGSAGAIHLPGARIGGQLSFGGARLVNKTGPALSASGLTCGGDVLFESMIAISRVGPTVDLSGVRIDGLLYGDVLSVEAKTADARVVLDGLTYRGVPGIGARRWLTAIQQATPTYAAQPYRQLAAALASEGHDAEVRRVLIAQRRDQLRRADFHWWERAWGHFTGVTLGYGYRPWLALVWLVGVVLASATLNLVVGAHVLHPNGNPTLACTRTERVLLGVDNALPLVTTAVGSRCTPGTGPGTAVTALPWIEVGTQIFGWAFATLFVAGFTSAVRRT